MSELIVSHDSVESFLPMLGCEVDDDGYIRDIESGEICLSPDGEKIPVDEVGYLGNGSDGGVEPIKDDFPTIVEYLSDNRGEWDDPQEELEDD